MSASPFQSGTPSGLAGFCFENSGRVILAVLKEALDKFLKALLMKKQDIYKVKEAYNTVASEYATQYFFELDKKPIDRIFLETFAARLKGKKNILEIGCGPGQVACFLNKLGVKVKGIDISDEMVTQARLLNPTSSFEQGDVLDLKYNDKSVDGIVAFYLIVNFALRDVKKAMAEIYRILKNGGIFLTSFHIGKEVIRLHEFLGKKVELDFIFHSPEEVVEIMERCCFVIDELIIRYPYRDAEYPSKRAYIFARKI